MYIRDFIDDLISFVGNIKGFSKLRVVRGGRKGSSSPYHTGPVLTIGISDDSKYLATGSADHSIIIWNPETLEVLFRLQRHRSPVTVSDVICLVTVYLEHLF